MSNEEFQKLVLKKFDSIDKRFDKIDKKFDNVDKRFDKLELDMKNGQDEILDMLRNLEAQNADRHREMSYQIEELKQDLNTIEKVTAKNWKDIANIKDLKKAK